MSCDWDIHCLDCKDNHGFNDANHEDDMMMELIRLAPEIAKIAPILSKISDCIKYDKLYIKLGSRYTLRVDWFVKHHGHRLIAIDEYGRCYDECGKYYVCVTCKTSKKCKRTSAHTGECNDERDI